MDKAHNINKFYALILILLGLFGFIMRYMELGDMQYTALIPAVFGLILFAFTKGIKNENAVIGHLAGVLTLILVVMSTVMLTKGLLAEFSLGRKQIIFLVVIVGGIYSLRAQFLYFRAQRRRKAKLK
ncbi:hypothetical protein EV201_2804 [Ancylomarina subtilis]|uniref:Uncharacterized protein n=1 Tax=Ancylomarina subtilis TaxID=1639035 RepID=A0A4Q7VAG5_9BACT|nr:hypothetical protein [Ancylomarina subtilis]RZT92333.1 hypothetical protein EV201_2804 [Ancylomarina subtilis]